jgi:small subunit ribosomal protein S25e
LLFLTLEREKMGGGKKKTTLKKMEKVRTRKTAQKESKPSKPGRSTAEKKIAGIVPLDSKSEKVLGELKKMKVLTPYMVASRFDVRIGVARGLLGELERRRIIQYVSGSKNIKIYKLAD